MGSGGLSLPTPSRPPGAPSPGHPGHGPQRDILGLVSLSHTNAPAFQGLRTPTQKAQKMGP